jgi:hypothetical protein
MPATVCTCDRDGETLRRLRPDLDCRAKSHASDEMWEEIDMILHNTT